MLKAMGIEEEKIEQIIEAHAETVDVLKEERDTFKANAEKLADVEKELTKAKDKLAKNGESETVSKEDFDRLKKEYDDYKADIDAKAIRSSKENAFRELLKSAGVGEKRMNAIIKVSDIDGIELDKNGKIKDADKRTETIKAEWADFIENTVVKGANTATPPTNNGGAKMSKADIYKKDDRGRYILSSEERQKALIENQIQ